MTITAAQLKDKWMACNNNVTVSQYINQIKRTKVGGMELLIMNSLAHYCIPKAKSRVLASKGQKFLSKNTLFLSPK